MTIDVKIWFHLSSVSVTGRPKIKLLTVGLPLAFYVNSLHQPFTYSCTVLLLCNLFQWLHEQIEVNIMPSKFLVANHWCLVFLFST